MRYPICFHSHPFKARLPLWRWRQTNRSARFSAFAAVCWVFSSRVVSVDVEPSTDSGRNQRVPMGSMMFHGPGKKLRWICWPKLMTRKCVFSSRVVYCFILCRLGWQNARVFHSNKPASSILQLWNWDDTRCSLDCFPFCANSQVGNPLSQVSRIILVGHCIAQHLHIRIWVIKSTLVDWLWLVIVIVISWKFYWLISGKMLSWDHDEP